MTVSPDEVRASVMPCRVAAVRSSVASTGSGTPVGRYEPTTNSDDNRVRAASPAFSEPVSSRRVCAPVGSAGVDPVAPSAVPLGTASSTSKVPSVALASTIAQIVRLACRVESSRL